MRERLQRLKEAHPSLVGYVLVGSLNTALDFVIYTVLSSVVGLEPVLANVLSTAVVASISFVLNYRVVFKSSRSPWHALGLFLGVTLFSAWVVQSAVVWGVVHGLGGALGGSAGLGLKSLAKIAAMGVGFIFNYFGYRWLFATRPDPATAPPV
jgi:putative flippase GtrA